MKPPIDLAHLDQYVLGDQALLDEILSIFIEQASSLIDRMDPSVDDETWHSTAHTLKGASRGVGAWELGDLAEQAERLVGGEYAKKRRQLSGEMRRAGTAAIDFARKVRDGEIRQFDPGRCG